MSMKNRITEKLEIALKPAMLAVIDESHQHEGHSGSRPGGETHYRVKISAMAFVGQSRLQRHRIINELLATELNGSIHALAIEAKAPGE